MKNKGFSLVELIIVIAVMAILAGTLAPVLIKYLNKARISVDIDMGREIANTIMMVVAQDSVKDSAKEHDTPWPVDQMDGDDFKKAVYDQLSMTTIKGKSKKDINGDDYEEDGYFYTLDVSKNIVQVYYGGRKDDYQVYPTTGSKIVE